MNFDLETAIEDAFIALIGNYTTTKIVRWDDVSEVHLGPISQTADVIKVKAVSLDVEQGTLNTYFGETLQVDIAAFASKKRDNASRVVNALRGTLREIIAEENIVDLLNAYGKITVYGNGVIPIGAFEASDEKNWGKGISVRIVAHPKN